MRRVRTILDLDSETERPDMTNTQDQVAVTQADRDAAAHVHECNYGKNEGYHRTLRGERDTEFGVQAFAHHRIAATRAGQATSDVAVRGALQIGRKYSVCVIKSDPFEYTKGDLAKIDAALATLTQSEEKA